MVDHLGLGSEGQAALAAIVARTLPGASPLEQHRVVQQVARSVVPLVVAAHELEVRRLRRQLDARREHDRRQDDRVLVLQNALRWFEPVEGVGWRATEALVATRWRPPPR